VPETTPPDLIVAGARLTSGALVDVVVHKGVVSAVEPAGQSAHAGAPATRTLEAGGRLLLPGFVEPHAHLDKALTANRVPNPSGDLAGAITAWIAARPTMTTADTAERAHEAALQLIANGTTVIRTHVDTGRGIETSGVEALERVRQQIDPLAELQLVVCASFPLTGADGDRNLAVARGALQVGTATAVGGAPYLDARPEEALHRLAELAAEHGLGLDLHVDETTDASVFTLPQVLALAERGFPHHIVAGHCVSLGQQDERVRRTTIERLAETGVAVVSLPETNLFLQGRSEHGPLLRGVPPLQHLLDGGATLALGGDNVRDPFNPMGSSDPLRTASLGVVAGHLRPDDAFEAVTGGARRALGLAAAGPAVGAVADFVLVRAATLGDALAGAALGRTVIRGGREVAATTTLTSFEASGERPTHPQEVSAR
jgi:cytosine deaminase